MLLNVMQGNEQKILDTWTLGSALGAKEFESAKIFDFISISNYFYST